MQGRAPQGQAHDNLRESEAQAKAGMKINAKLKSKNAKLMCHFVTLDI